MYLPKTGKTPMFDYQPLTAWGLTGAVTVARPAPPKSVTLESSAFDVMTDLRHTHAAVIEPHVSMEFANSYMMRRGVRSLLVLNKDETLGGVITAADILGEKPMRFVQERSVKHNEILVSDIMTPLDHLEIIPIDELLHARVGHIIASFHDTGRQHILVIESNAETNHSVCGIFSFTQIERQLGTTIPSTKVAGNFAEIEKTLVSN